MTRHTPFLFLFLLAVPATGQVQLNILELYDAVPAPPADVRAAFARAECTGQGVMLDCATEKFFKPTEERIDAISRKISEVGASLAKEPAVAMKEMDPDQMKKKLASMSPAEQMKYAMEMSKQMGASRTPLPEPAAVTVAVDECTRLLGQIAADMQNIVEITKKKAALSGQRDTKHSEIGEWEASEAKEIPLVDGGEAGRFPDPKLSHELRVKAMEKHIAAENDYLKALPREWKDLLKSERLRYTPLQQKLAAIHYGEDARNARTKEKLIQGQGMMLGPITELVSTSKEATDHAVNWWRQKLALDSQKPQ